LTSERGWRWLWLGAALLAGCAAQRTTLDASVADVHAAADLELDFWDELATRRVVTNNDALHGLLLLAGGDAAADYAGRVELGRQRGWLGRGAAPPANQSATVGMVSVALCDILEIRGGLLMHLVGPWPRYCTRELIYLGIIPDRTENQSLTGLEFVDLVRRAADSPQQARAAASGPAPAGRP
jgi:hypothetical protein